MANESSNWWNKVILWLTKLFKSLSNSETSLLPTILKESENSSEESQASSSLKAAVDEAKKQLTSAAVESITRNGMDLFSKYTNMLSSLDPKQKEYVLNIAILKNANMDDMSAEEIIELGRISIRTSEIGLEISDELNTFWSQFTSVVKELASQFKDIGSRVIATSLVGVLF